MDIIKLIFKTVSDKLYILFFILLLIVSLFITYKVKTTLNYIKTLKQENVILKRNITTLEKELQYEKDKLVRDKKLIKYKKDVTQKVKKEISEKEEEDDVYEILATDSNDTSTN